MTEDGERRTGRGSVVRRRGFTLIEIVLAVVILSMMSLAIYRFVQSNMTALRLSSEASATDASYDALREVLTAQWQALPSGSGSLSGDTLKLNGQRRDEIRWVTGPGPGLLTRYAGGDYSVAMRLQPPDKKTNELDLGFLRRSKNDDSPTGANDSWVPLLTNVQFLEIRYFDPRLNVWLDKWTDTVTLPRLVKVTIGRNDAAVPWEAIIPLARTAL